MPRTDSPSAAELIHLRPQDAHGAAITLLVTATTVIGGVLSVRGGWPVWFVGQIVLATAFVQWFVVLHECGHETLFRTTRWNVVVGQGAAFMALIPFRSWTRVHGRHHKWTGWQDLDPTTESLVPRELTRTERTLVNVCWRLWIPLFSVLYRVTNYWNLPRLLRLFPGRTDRYLLLRDAAVLIGAYAAVVVWLEPALVARIVALALVVSLVVEDLLLLSQHTHIPQHVSHGEPVRPYPAIEQETFTRSLRLPSVVSRLVLHFDAHELHHMYPFVPGYHLRRIRYQPINEIGWREWVRRAKALRADVLLFQNRADTGWDL